jgi:hypothetical protein
MTVGTAPGRVRDQSSRALAPVPIPAVHDHPQGRASAIRRHLASLERGALLGAGAALWVWLGDIASQAPGIRALGTRRAWTALGGALFVAMTTAMVLGALLGPFLAPVARQAAWTWQRWRRRLSTGGREAQHAMVAGLLAGAMLVPATGWLLYRGSLAVVLGFARPESMALVLAVAGIGFLALMALAWPWAAASWRPCSSVPRRPRSAVWPSFTH